MEWYEIVFGFAVWLLALIIYGKIKDDFYGYKRKKRK